MIVGGFFALLAAFGFTIDGVLIRKGLMEDNAGNVWDIRLISSVVSVGIFILGVSIAALFGFDVFQEFQSLTPLTILILVISGILGALVGAILWFMAIAQIGASHASALWGGSNPLFAVLFAALFLGEIPDPMGIFAVLLIVSGIVSAGYHAHEGIPMLLAKTKMAGGLIAILSGISFALSQVGRGAAIKLGATPVSSFFFLQVTALIIILAICVIKAGNLKYLAQINRKSLYYYSAAGGGSFVGSYSVLVAMSLMPVWQAVAIRNVQPLLVVFLSWIILKKEDKINVRLVVGAVLVTIGVIILNVYK